MLSRLYNNNNNYGIYKALNLEEFNSKHAKKDKHHVVVVVVVVVVVGGQAVVCSLVLADFLASPSVGLIIFVIVYYLRLLHMPVPAEMVRPRDAHGRQSSSQTFLF